MIIKPRQEHILDVATELFHKLGYFQTGIAEINKQAGVSKGVFYHYFPGGKLQLVKSVLQRDYDNSYAMMSEYFHGNDAVTATQLFINNLKSKVNTPDYTNVRVSVLFTEMMEAKDVDPTIVKLAKDTFKMLENFIVDKLVAKGVSEKDALRRAQLANAMIEGGVSVGIIQESTQYLEFIGESIADVLNGSI
jgi:Transcriptional regulator